MDRMKHDWKPGDVALVNDCTQPDEPWKVALCIASAVSGASETRWRIDTGEVWSSVSEARPLVVIDPEDREQVERLALSYDAAMAQIVPDLYDRAEVVPGDVDDAIMQAAIREFVNPKPPKCGAHVNLAGEDFRCVEPPEHGGGHRNPDAQAVWGDGS